MLMMINILTWNIRGAAAKGVPFLIKDLVARHHVSCMALFETRVSGSKATKIISSLGFDSSFVVDAEGFAGGIWLMWKSQDVHINIIQSHRQFVHAQLVPGGTTTPSLITFVYGSPQMAARNLLWTSLEVLSASITAPWMVIGDFNAYLGADEKFGGAAANATSMRRFRDCMECCHLSDMGFKGPPFTWEWRGVKERLDRGICNLAWLEVFPESSILHLPQLKSDHKPLLLRCSDQEVQDTHDRPFRFMSCWLLDNRFPHVVLNAWKNNHDWFTASESFRMNVTDWNSQVFGDVFRRKRRLMRRLEGINAKLHMRHNPFLHHLQRKLWKLYNRTLVQEESIWQQKSRCMWVKHSDRNTRFFHVSTKTRRKRNRIEALTDDNGTLVTDLVTLRSMTVEFFGSLYSSSGVVNPLPSLGAFQAVEYDVLQDIQAQFSAEEVKQAVFSMGPLKAPGPDGLQPIFFQKHWEIVGDSVVKLIHDCYLDHHKIKEINETLLVLIPKVDKPDSLK
ncbi:uncharacterized protein LOC130725635 [Lotus japonicus]|uniref:uncharacterized protein LOC130725635 n=1 Tax=Lotus japonicus TaxID=34305 RepID=UPI00258F6B18|nr:uncharacterized protein LOC130725635 [Lotus japonicus]